jgi:hypothetical protein
VLATLLDSEDIEYFHTDTENFHTKSGWILSQNSPGQGSIRSVEREISWSDIHVCCVFTAG